MHVCEPFFIDKKNRICYFIISISTLSSRVLTGVSDMLLTDRERLILQTIIDDFVRSAHPIGSRKLSKNKQINLSAATIRNVMADLEEKELLEKTHTSSGRIPSEKGYRYYVDHFISPTLKQKNLSIISHIIEDNIYELEQIVQLSTEMLSQLTNYTAIILGPDVTEATLKQVQILPVTEDTAVAILVTSTGHVEHKSFTIPKGILGSDLEKIVNILNDRLVGVPIMNLTYALETEVYELMKKHIKDYEHMFEYIKSVICYDESVKLYVDGKANLLTQPEFKDVEKVYDFYSFLEEEEAIVNLLMDHGTGLHVRIGKENKVDAVKNLSLITSTFRLNKEQFGTIALIGPMRMEYRKVISLLQSLSNELTNILFPENDDK